MFFDYCLEDNSSTYFDVNNQVKFDPPAYEQRYATTIRILEDSRWKHTFKKIVEFGCADLRLLMFLRRIAGVENIVEVDIDEDVLLQHQQNARPLLSDYLQKRDTPLRVEIYQGSIDTAAEELRNTDVVIGLEIIEHLYDCVLNKVPDNIFGFLQPKLVIFSTPNSEYNEIFGAPKFPNGFRHIDHKFEWTRAEFEKWTSDICHRYPNYRVSIIGVGKAPTSRQSVGHLTQMAIFARLDLLGKELVNEINSFPPANTNPHLKYKEIYRVDFPFVRDERTKSDKILTEVKYHLNRFQHMDEYFDCTQLNYRIPVSVLLCNINTDINTTETELYQVLHKHSIQTQDNFVILPLQNDDSEDDMSDDKQFQNENDANRSDVTYDSDEVWN